MTSDTQKHTHIHTQINRHGMVSKLVVHTSIISIEFNLLGTIIHETLEWTRHIDKVANKISRTLEILNKLKHVLPIYTLKTMYSALIVPHFNYNILLWGFNSKIISKLQKRQLKS